MMNSAKIGKIGGEMADIFGSVLIVSWWGTSENSLLLRLKFWGGVAWMNTCGQILPPGINATYRLLITAIFLNLPYHLLRCWLVFAPPWLPKSRQQLGFELAPLAYKGLISLAEPPASFVLCWVRRWDLRALVFQPIHVRHGGQQVNASISHCTISTVNHSKLEPRPQTWTVRLTKESIGAGCNR